MVLPCKMVVSEKERIGVISTICLIRPSLLKEQSTFLTYMGFSIFFNLNSCFLTNSKLIASLIVLLSNNASTIILSCISILSSSIFTVTSLKRSPLFRLYENVFFATLLVIRQKCEQTLVRTEIRYR